MTRINITGRSIQEWRGATPDTKIPPHVRLRVFERFDGICQLTRRKIRAGEAWALDHIVPLADGGEHCETNLQPVLKEPHQEKTSAENTARAKVRAIKSKHIGIKESRNPLPGSKRSKWKRKMDGTVVER